jgi:hypothetical protein
VENLNFSNGGTLNFQSVSYINFTIDRCTFAECGAVYGGAIYVDNLTSMFLITRSRFEDNFSHLESSDIFWGRKCSQYDKHVTFSSCSTSKITRVRCESNNGLPELQENCTNEVVFSFNMNKYIPFLLLHFICNN